MNQNAQAQPRRAFACSEDWGDMPMPTGTQDLWVLLWSKSQAALHIEPMPVCMLTNFHIFMQPGAQPDDYILLYAGPEDEVRFFADDLGDYVRAHAEADLALGLRDDPP